MRGSAATFPTAQLDAPHIRKNAYNFAFPFAFPSPPTRKIIISESGRNFKYSVVVLRGGPRFRPRFFPRFFPRRASVIRGREPFGESLPAYEPCGDDTDNG